MSQDNVEIVEQIAAAFRVGDFDAIGRHFDSQIEWHEDPSFPEAGVYRGIEAVAHYARQFRSEFDRIRYETLEVLDAGTHVIARMRVTGTGKTSGADFETEAWWDDPRSAARSGRFRFPVGPGARAAGVGLHPRIRLYWDGPRNSVTSCPD